MNDKWIVQLQGGWKQSKKMFREYDKKLQDTKVFEWWDYSKNKKRPEDYPPKSSTKAWFKCSIGHSFQSKICRVFDATHKESGGCASCGGRIKFLKNGNNIGTTHPKIAKFWNNEKNIGSPKDYPSGSTYIAWWNCDQCNSLFKKSITLITRKKTGSSIVACFKCEPAYGYGMGPGMKFFLFEKYPKVIKNIWDFKKNSIDPKLIGINDQKIHWWKCLIHGSVRATVKRAIKNNYCEKCVSISRTSEIEIKIYFELKTIFEDIINQKTIAKRQIDLFLPEENIGIEFDGYPWHLNKEKKDLEKNKLIENSGIRMIRIRDEKLDNSNFPNAIIIYHSEYSNFIKVLKKLLIKVKTLITDKSKIDKINKYLKAGKLINVKEYAKIRAKFSLADTDRSLSNLKEVCKYFDLNKNYPLTTDHFTSGSTHKVWWTCDKGHSMYQEIINFRRTSIDQKTLIIKCYKCYRNKKGFSEDIMRGLRYNNLKIYKEYDDNKNTKKIRPDVTSGSKKFVWWKCNKGHSWQSFIWERAVKDIKHCPKCNPISWEDGIIKR
jgi:hypothetical protein